VVVMVVLVVTVCLLPFNYEHSKKHPNSIWPRTGGKIHKATWNDIQLEYTITASGTENLFVIFQN
jgi:hypothetical protein